MFRTTNRYRHPTSRAPAQAGIYHQRAPSLNQDSCLRRNDGVVCFALPTDIVIPLAASLRRQGSTISAHQALTKIPAYAGMTALCVSHYQQISSSH
ncbi:hypothetical protein L4C42_09250 [Vibrio wakamikoensis]|uniref:hypothetical protein n=1 Tax=Vibrio wakamikoensis TaxID=2910251 RepID=UPI003D19BEB1